MPLQLAHFQGRLAQFKPWTNRDEDWDKHWAAQGSQQGNQRNSVPPLGEYEIFTRYLPKDLPVLEAGCGLGTVVAALEARGYRIEGVDYAKKTIQRAREVLPHLNLKVGDIYNLDVPDGTYGGYISLGVLEHNPSGPMAGLREARRILHPQGVAIITIPFLNAKRARILKRRLEELPTKNLSEELNFYQFYFSSQEFSQHLESARFRVVELYPFAVEWGLNYDYRWAAWLRERGFFHWRLHAMYNRCCQSAPRAIRHRYAHMMMYVCRPA